MSYEMYKIAAENTLDTIVVVDNQARVGYVSPSIKTLSGFGVEEYKGMDAYDLLHEEDRERVRASYESVVQTKAAVDVEYRVQHADGHTVYVETRVKPVLDEAGNVKYVVMNHLNHIHPDYRGNGVFDTDENGMDPRRRQRREWPSTPRTSRTARCPA